MLAGLLSRIVRRGRREGSVRRMILSFVLKLRAVATLPFCDCILFLLDPIMRP